MYKQPRTNMSFSSPFVDIRTQTRPNQFYAKVNELVNWQSIENKINKHYKRGHNVAGQAAYPGLLLFKMLLLGIWNGMSDYEVEDLVKDSLSASRFCGLELEDDVPDHSTLCRFRGDLTQKKVFDKLLKLLNKQLEQKGVMVKTVTKVDASITDTPRKPRGTKTYEVTDNNQVKEYHKSSVDQQAKWTKKNGKLRYGYKKHIITDDNGLIINTQTTSANTHDHQVFETLVEQAGLDEGTTVQADKGYASQQHNNFLADKKLINHIQSKAQKNKPLTHEQKQHNKHIAKTRYMVERSFGSIKRWFKASEARYVGLDKTHSQHILESIAYNLKRLPVLMAKIKEKEKLKTQQQLATI